MVQNAETHIRIAQTLLLKLDWGVDMPQFEAKVFNTNACVSDIQVNMGESPQSLQDADWFWGSITR